MIWTGSAQQGVLCASGRVAMGSSKVAILRCQAEGFWSGVDQEFPNERKMQNEKRGTIWSNCFAGEYMVSRIDAVLYNIRQVTINGAIMGVK